MTATTTATTSGALAAPGERGRLEVSERVVVAIARAAAAEVDGIATPTQAKQATRAGGITTQIGEQLQGAVGRPLPRASAQVAGHRARVTVEVALLWPHPAAATAAAVREHVSSRLEELAAVRADAVAVTISSVVRATRTTGTRRVQ